MGIDICGVEGLPEIEAGADLARLIGDALSSRGRPLQDGDIVVVAQKAVSKAEGRVVELASVTPSDFSYRVAVRHGKDPHLVQLVLDETDRVVRMHRGTLIVQTRHGFVCANAGVDVSNVRPGLAVLLPVDPDASARSLCSALGRRFGVDIAVIVSDSFGRPWRLGQTNVAIGVAGISVFADYIGQRDGYGNELKVTQIAVADELAAAAELVMGKVRGVPVAVVRGYRFDRGDGRALDLVRSGEQDLFL